MPAGHQNCCAEAREQVDLFTALGHPDSSETAALANKHWIWVCSHDDDTGNPPTEWENIPSRDE